MYSYGPFHMAEQRQNDQLAPTYSSSVKIRGIALGTCRKRWMTGKGDEWGADGTTRWWWWWYIYTNPSARTGCGTRSIFKRSSTGLNSEFSFSQTGCLTKAKRTQSAQLLTDYWKENNWIHTVPKCYQLRPGIELVSMFPFPMTITILPRAIYIYIYIYMCVCVCVCVCAEKGHIGFNGSGGERNKNCSTRYLLRKLPFKQELKVLPSRKTPPHWSWAELIFSCTPSITNTRCVCVCVFTRVEWYTCFYCNFKIFFVSTKAKEERIPLV